MLINKSEKWSTQFVCNIFLQKQGKVNQQRDKKAMDRIFVPFLLLVQLLLFFTVKLTARTFAEVHFDSSLSKAPITGRVLIFLSKHKEIDGASPINQCSDDQVWCYVVMLFKKYTMSVYLFFYLPFRRRRKYLERIFLTTYLQHFFLSKITFLDILCIPLTM